MYRLYHYPLSPFSRKVRLVLAEKGIDVELIEERYWEPRPEFLRMNPGGKVPVLKIGKLVLSESTAICEYLDDIHPEPALMPVDAEKRAEVRRLVGWFDDKFYREVTLNLLDERLLKKVKGVGHPESKNVRVGLKNIHYHMNYMSFLLDRRRWLAGDRMTLADFSAAAQISCLDYIGDVDWNSYDLVKDWYAKIKSRPAFRPLLADRLSVKGPEDHYTNLDF